MTDSFKAILVAVIGAGSGTGVVLVNNMFGRRNQSVTSDSIVVQSSTAVVQLLRDQMLKMQAEIDKLRNEADELKIEVATERSGRRLLEEHVERLEEAITELGGAIPARPGRTGNA